MDEKLLQKAFFGEVPGLLPHVEHHHSVSSCQVGSGIEIPRRSVTVTPSPNMLHCPLLLSLSIT